MHQKILEIKPGRLFKGYSSSIDYTNNDHITVRQTYYNTTIIDCLSTKESFFSKRIYTQQICPRYIMNAIKSINPKNGKPGKPVYTNLPRYEFIINTNNSSTETDIKFIVNDMYNQIEMIVEIHSEKHVNFTTHKNNIDIANKSKNALKAFKALFKNTDIINRLREELENSKILIDKDLVYMQDPFKINLLYLLNASNMSISDFIVIDNLERDVNSY